VACIKQATGDNKLIHLKKISAACEQRLLSVKPFDKPSLFLGSLSTREILQATARSATAEF
jgi:hypothetical protein